MRPHRTSTRREAGSSLSSQSSDLLCWPSSAAAPTDTPSTPPPTWATKPSSQELTGLPLQKVDSVSESPPTSSFQLVYTEQTDQVPGSNSCVPEVCEPFPKQPPGLSVFSRQKRGTQSKRLSPKANQWQPPTVPFTNIKAQLAQAGSGYLPGVGPHQRAPGKSPAH